MSMALEFVRPIKFIDAAHLKSGHEVCPNLLHDHFKREMKTWTHGQKLLKYLKHACPVISEQELRKNLREKVGIKFYLFSTATSV